MTESITTGLFTIALIVVVGYFIRLDMSDITGMARKAARQGMGPLAESLKYQRIEPRTAQQQGGLEKQYSGFQIRVDGDLSRIQVEFRKNTGLRLSSLSQNDFDEGKLAAVQFSDQGLNRFFPLRAAGDRWQQQLTALESLLQPLTKQFDARGVKFVYIRDEYLRIGFHHRNYLPVSVIENAIPVLETFAREFVKLQQQRKSQ